VQITWNNSKTFPSPSSMDKHTRWTCYVYHNTLTSPIYPPTPVNDPVTTSVSHGDPVFCGHFKRANQTNSVRDRDGCESNFNSNSIARTIPTDQGTVIPSCWESMHLLIRKQIKKTIPAEYLCDSCTIECTTTGNQVSTTGHVIRYIRVHKNPGHVATFPTRTGKITVQIWFSDFDVPSIREITCPRILISTLIRCSLQHRPSLDGAAAIPYYPDALSLVHTTVTSHSRHASTQLDKHILCLVTLNGHTLLPLTYGFTWGECNNQRSNLINW
jgi:hypothetical protein